MSIRQKVQTIAVATSLLGLVAMGSAQASHSTRSIHSRLITNSQLELRQDMRQLWEDHITWTRVYIIAAVADAPDASAAATRLLKNQEDIGEAFASYYGNAAGLELTDLLKVHITTAVDLIAAAKSGDTAAYTTARVSWSANAEDIAVFLNGLNSRWWSLNDLRSMLNSHLELTEQEVVHRLNSNWAADVQAYDAVHEEALMMADALSLGIIQQFPMLFLLPR